MPFMLEPASYDGRKKMIKAPSKKYLLGCTGVVAQTISRGGAPIWRTVNGRFMRNRRSVWMVPTRSFKGAHFATFLPDLIRTCITAGCPAGGVVFDPFMGAGTTAIVARELGRNYIGIELNAKYVKLAEERLIILPQNVLLHHL
jgi:DNA modification methylase